MPALQRPDRFSTGAFSSLPPAFSSPQEFAAWAAVSAEAVPASRLPEEECAALDARPPEVFAAARVEPQAVDHSVLVAESHESAPDDFPVESARACSVVPPVADSSPDDSELLPAGWLGESARACSVVPPVADSSLDDSDLLPAGWQVESVRVCSVVPPVADSSLDDSELSPAGWQVESARVCSVVPPVADSSLDDSELLPAGWQAESARACSAVLALGGLARTDAHSQPEQCPDDWPEAWLQVDPVRIRMRVFDHFLADMQVHRPAFMLLVAVLPNNLCTACRCQLRRCHNLRCLPTVRKVSD